MGLVPQGGSPEHAGRWLEYGSNVVPRGMIAGQACLAYRIRPIDLSHLFLFVTSYKNYQALQRKSGVLLQIF